MSRTGGADGELTVGDVLAEPSLELTLKIGSGKAIQQVVRWAAVTELPDPAPFLTGGELILSTGLQQRTGALQQRFVERIAAAGAVGLGFGTGLTHPRVPAGILRAAGDLDLPVFEVPYSIPFLAIDRFVADHVLAASHRRSRQLLETYDQLSTAVLSAQALDGLVARLHAAVGAPVAVIDIDGQVLSAAPRSAAWPVGQILQTPPVGLQDGPLRVRPVELTGSVVAYLCSRPGTRDEAVLPYAVALVGLEISRRRAVLEGRRLLLAEVLVDVVAGGLTESEGARRLDVFGIDLTKANAVVIGAVPGLTPEQFRRLTAGPLPTPAAATAWMDEALVAVVPEDSMVRVEQSISAGLARSGAPVSVGVGSPRTGTAGLRWSYHEARQALSRGVGVHHAQGLSLAGLLAASQDVPLKDLADRVLQPLRDFDEQHGAQLVATLQAYLDLNGSVSEVAATLVLHRNTVRYRLDQITRLTGRGVDTTADRMQWYLALLA